jgi:SIR2-like domain
MIDRLKQFLRQPSALITIGYSFSDEHLNDVLIHASKNNQTSVIFGLLYKNLDEEPGIKKLARKSRLIWPSWPVIRVFFVDNPDHG